jgi:predicted outer membrane protein
MIDSELLTGFWAFCRMNCGNDKSFRLPPVISGAALMRTHLLGALASLATLALVSCGAPSTPEFVQKGAMSDMYEVEAGKIAGQKGESDAVKQFGQHIVEAHSQTTEELKGIVQAEKIEVDLPTKLDDKHQRMIDDLNAAHAGDFDKTYAQATGQRP